MSLDVNNQLKDDEQQLKAIILDELQELDLNEETLQRMQRELMAGLIAELETEQRLILEQK